MFAIGSVVRVVCNAHEADGALGEVVRAQSDETGARYLVNFETFFGEYADWVESDLLVMAGQQRDGE
jgi:hypothetical protein